MSSLAFPCPCLPLHISPSPSCLCARSPMADTDAERCHQDELFTDMSDLHIYAWYDPASRIKRCCATSAQRLR
eukprot:1694072-Rhodomonas_salina.1